MNFCDECGSMMKTEGETWVCGSCGHEQARSAAESEQMKTTQSQEASEVIDMSETDEEAIGPTTTAHCPDCGHDTARYEMKQIRAADESETRFFTCTDCGQKWREDDH